MLRVFRAVIGVAVGAWVIAGGSPEGSPERGYSVPLLDLAGQSHRQVVVDREAGRYRVRLEDNRHRWDCAYPGVEMLPDGTIVATTYGHWTAGEEPWILSVRVTLDELDAMAGAME